MAAPANGQAEHDEGDELPTSHLTRPTPDAILADEADENALLGNESDSEHSGSRRDSFGSTSNENATKTVGRDLSEGRGVESIAPEQTPTQGNFPATTITKPIARKAPPPPTLEELQAQVADLTNQVTGLNSKLVTSFMRVSDLEDDLSDKQQQLGWHREKVSSLEKEREEHLAALNTGLLVEKAHVSSEMQKMMDRVIEETAQRGKAISDKEKIEAELDELSSSLFAEANKMVAVERLARARADEKSRSMEDRLKDTEEIMEQQQKRLVALQDVVEKVNTSKDSAPEGDGEAAKGVNGQMSSDSGKMERSNLPYVNNDLIRLDVVPYIELRAFLNHLRKLRLQLAPFYNYPIAPASPSTAASPGGSRTASPGPLSNRSVSGTQTGISTLTASSALSPFTTAGVARHKDFPNLPANVEQLITLSSQLSSVSFLKRVNEEDCEPCLRLDAAPGLNWLSRRQMHTSILDGNLLIEPVFGGGIYDEAEVRQRAQGSPPTACAMCGRIVLNVPLPGSSAGEVSTAGHGAHPTHAREPSGTPPMGSTAFFSSSSATNNSTNQGVASKLQKKSSTGLFSTLRSMGGSSPRPSLTKSPSADMTGAQNDSTVEEDPFAARQPPIPTHIFRISETSTSRYLLCPEYCLRRLRVTCNFWSYIRHLERAVVLEGKLAWDDEHTEKQAAAAAAASEKANLPPNTIEDVKEGNVAEDATTGESADREEIEKEKDAEEDAKTEVNDDDSDKGEAKEVEEKAAAEEPAEEPEDKESSPIEQKSRPGSHTRQSSTTGSTDGEDGFADAQSIASTGDAEQAEARQAETEVEAVEETAAADVKTEPPTTTESDEKALPTPAFAKLPPLPPRSNVRRPVPLPPPSLPPRQSTASPSPVPALLGPEPKRVIPSNAAAAGDSTLSWEEKVWLEMMRHKADMWSARVGLYKESV